MTQLRALVPHEQTGSPPGPLRVAWEVGLAIEFALLGVWLLFPTIGWAVAATGLALAVLSVSAWGGRPARVAIAVVILTGAGAALHTSLRVRSVESNWTEVRESLIQRASQRLESTLAEAVAMVEALAVRGANLDLSSQAEAFAVLEGGLAGKSPERGVVVFEQADRPFAWAGGLRLSVRPEKSGLRARITPFYVVLEAQNEGAHRVAVGQVVLYADSSVPNPDRTVTAQFLRATGVNLRFFSADFAPNDPDVFDYCLPRCDAAAPVDTLFSVEPVPPAQGTLKLNYLDRGGRRVAAATAVALLALIIIGGTRVRWVSVFALGLLFVFTPLGDRLGLDALFSHGSYSLTWLRVLPLSAGTLIVISAMWLVVLAARWSTSPRRRWTSIVPAVVLFSLLPWMLRSLASGVTPTAAGPGLSVWMAWTLVIALPSTAVLVTVTRFVRDFRPPSLPGWLPVAAVASGALAAALGLAVWQPSTGWPTWYPVAWLPAFLFAVQANSRFGALGAAAIVSGMIATLLSWGASVNSSLILAERDVQRYAQEADPFGIGYLERFGLELQAGPVPTNSAELYSRWRRSPLSQNDYPAVLSTWREESELARLELAELALSSEAIRRLVQSLDERREPMLQAVQTGPGAHFVLSVPYPDGVVVTVAVGPRSLAVPPVRVARFLRGDASVSSPYEIVVSDGMMQPISSLSFRREGYAVRGERTFAVPGGVRHLHIQIPFGESVGGTLIRGALLTALAAFVAGLFWLVGEGLRDATYFKPALTLIASQSFRTRLTLVLAVFFIVPTVGFAVFAAGRLGAEVRRTRDLVTRQTLRDAAGTAFNFAVLGQEPARQQLDEIANRLDADLLLYDNGELLHSSAPVLMELGVVEPYVTPSVFRRLVLEDEIEGAADRDIGGRATRVGYRRLTETGDHSFILAAPRLLDDRGSTDFYALLLLTILGLTAAAWLAARAARALAEPVQALSDAAVAVGSGQPLPEFDPDTPDEFVPVVNAFQNMARDVREHQKALVEALDFTGAVLRNVATGVITLNGDLQVTTANPRAIGLLGRDPPSYQDASRATDKRWKPLWQWVRAFLAQETDTDTKEFTIDDMRVRAHIAKLPTEEGGCVLALDDATELAMAERVLAWGDMARQVAHEIKNPLTPIRLGIQHLQRTHRDRRGDFDATLDRTSRQILAEIERLDAIARAFSRFGAPPAEASPLAMVDLAAVARETAALYALSDSGVAVDVRGSGRRMLRRDEFKEVLVNLIENSRAASASAIQIEIAPADAERARVTIRDNGTGIPTDNLARVFEPQFSTKTSNTGLGLAICKRLVESWGGTIHALSTTQDGTAIIIEV